MEKYKQLREAAEAQAEAAHEAQVRAAQEAVRQLIAQNRPNVERREQLLSEKLDKKRQKEVSELQIAAGCRPPVYRLFLVPSLLHSP